MKYLTSTTLFDFLRRKFKYFLFKRLTSQSLPLFLRGKDIISCAPLVDGVHEKAITSLINALSDEGFCDFLLDVGANIGLTSCQNGTAFKTVSCFEPNPLAANILKTNLAISLPKDRFTVNEFALGDKEGDFELFVPKHNWGGAFVRSSSNSYPDELLAAKDEFESFDRDNYVVASVPVKPAKATFSEIFSAFKKSGFQKGVIKIDVEGFESIVLSGIAAALPADISTVVIFENWDEKFSFDNLQRAFANRQISINKIERTIGSTSKPAIVKLLKLIFFKADKHHLVNLADAPSKIGDIVIEIT